LYRYGIGTFWHYPCRRVLCQEITPYSSLTTIGLIGLSTPYFYLSCGREDNTLRIYVIFPLVFLASGFTALRKSISAERRMELDYVWQSQSKRADSNWSTLFFSQSGAVWFAAHKCTLRVD
jgi:hypothetical protein